LQSIVDAIIAMTADLVVANAESGFL
jgi:hypothetical protein